jgi:hypothetical protein
MAAENIRDLQHRTGHCRCRLRRQRVFPLLSGLLAGRRSRSSGLSMRAILERPAAAGPSMEAFVERTNLMKALEQVQRNKGRRASMA